MLMPTTNERRYQRLLVAAIDAELGPRRWSRRHLAELAGINPQTLDRVFTFKRDMNVEQFGAIAAALGVTTDSLVMKAEEFRGRFTTGIPEQDAMLDAIDKQRKVTGENT